VLAFIRAYNITGDNKYKTQAKSIFDQVWARGYDTALGGGIWWNTSKQVKCACINAPAGIAAVKLSIILSDSSYLTKAQSIYTWMKATLWDNSNGSVWDNINTVGAVDIRNYTYNQGTFIGLAHQLYLQTGTISYYNDAIKAADFTKNLMVVPGTDMLKTEEVTADEPGFKGIFARYFLKFALQYNLTSYITWMQGNSDSVYNHRLNGIMNDNWSIFHSGGTLASFAASSGVVIMQVTPQNGLANNLTLNKTATTSADCNASENGAMGVDATVSGNSKWCGNNVGDKWINVDLGATKTINRYEVQHAGISESVGYNTRNFKLQKSPDGTTWTDVDTVTGNVDNQTIKYVTSFTARYVRLLITQAEQAGNGAARIYEFEVFGN
jgi:hypothetical protein